MISTVALETTFRALGDPTRRRVIERLTEGPASMTELQRPFSISLPTLARHLGVLERSGLIRSTKHGRVRTYRLVPSRLRSAEHWLSRQHALWVRRLDQLDEHLKTMKENGT